MIAYRLQNGFDQRKVQLAVVSGGAEDGLSATGRNFVHYQSRHHTSLVDARRQFRYHVFQNLMCYVLFCRRTLSGTAGVAL